VLSSARGHEGILVVDKPVGPTSFDVVHKLRRAMGTREIGHCGTLDPLASGVVVVCVGRYTRLVRFLTADDKRYRARVTFGFSTPSLDLETAPDAFGDVGVVDAKRVEAALRTLARQTDQVPPLHSAVQQGGERLYQKARRGEDVEVAPRPVVVRSLTLVALGRRVEGADDGGRVVVDADIDVDVGKGYFVRALARDLGGALGCPAHLSALRRTQSGAYGLDDAVALDEARDPDLGPARLRRGPGAVRGMPVVSIDASTAQALRFGQKPPTSFPPVRDALAVTGDEIVAVVDSADGRLRTVRGF
jgi:tRNA pseudouridine55 synthase